jgi:hypothetical protein
LLGLALLTKAAAITLLGACGVGALVEIVRASGLRARLAAAQPWLLALAIAGAVGGWYYARNRLLYDQWVTTAFEHRIDGNSKMLPYRDLPYFERRDARFVLGWSTEIFREPFYPSGLPRFFPVLLATTFADYYNFSFAPLPDPGAPSVQASSKPMRPRARALARASVAGGVVVALTVVLAWIACVAAALRRRRADELALLAAPLFALAGAIHFATLYPLDDQGHIKATFLQYSSAPLFALFGLGVTALGRRRWTRPLLILEAIAFAAVASYTIYCRFV